MAEGEVTPGLGEILTFIDDHRIEAVSLVLRQARRIRDQAVEGIRLAKVGADRRRAAAAGRRHGRWRSSRPRGDGAEVVGQRPVVAEVERPLAALERRAELGQRQLRLAGTGSTGDAQMKQGEFQLPRPVREPAGNAADQRPRPADQRADIGFELDHVAQEAMHLLRLITATAAVSPAGSTPWISAGNSSRRDASTMCAPAQGPHCAACGHGSRGSEEVVDLRRRRIGTRVELSAQRVDVACQLRDDTLDAAGIAL